MATRIDHAIRCLEQAYDIQQALASEPDVKDTLTEKVVLRLIDEAWGHAVAAREGQD